MAADDGGSGALDGEAGWGGGTRTRPFSDYILQPQPQLQMLTTTTTTTLTSPVLDHERASYGVGGKSRAIRRSGRSVPYDRPALGRHAAAGPQAAASAQALAGRTVGGGSRLGYGFSKIITTGATYLYSSIFRRRLPAPVQVSDVEAHDLDTNEQILSPSVDADDIQVGNVPVGHFENHDQHQPDGTNSSPSDIENLMKKKTLSRDEFQRLSVLLQSRIVSNEVEKKPIPKQVEVETRSSREEVHPSGVNQSEAQRWRQDLQKSREERENGVRTLTVYDYGRSSTATPAGASEKLDAQSSSPVEVAIAFMGGRASQQAGSPAEPLNQRDENRLSSGPRPVSQPPLAKWAAPDYLNEDPFRTPPPQSVHSSWGRNRAISRTPYSRPLRLQPPRERAIDGTFGTPSAIRWTPIRTPVTGGREMLKRRSTVLDESWTSGGPIRRTRHKAIGSGTPSDLGQSRGSAFPMTPCPGSSLMALPSPVAGKLGNLSPRRSVTSLAKEKDVLVESGTFYVPAQSSETARKILETLEKMTPSPQGKALGDELAIVRGRPPATLTQDMLNDQARKSMTFVEYSSPQDSREPGPSGRGVEDSLSLGYPAATIKIDPSPKAKGKGKASLAPTENGPGKLGGLLAAQERILSTGDGSVKQISTRPRETGTVLASETDKGKGFRMNAVFEESGSEDEGRLPNTSVPKASLAIPISKLPNAYPKSSAATPTVFGTATLSSTTITGPGLSSFPATSVFAVETSKTVSSSGFTFPIPRVSLEGPPTPKAMSPASTSPKAIPAIPLFPFAQATELPAASGSALELNSTAAKVESQSESKATFSFGLPSASAASMAQSAPKLQLPLESKTTSFNNQNSFSGTSSSIAAPAMFSALTPGVAASSPSSSSSKFGDTSLAPTSSTALKVGGIPLTASPLLPLSNSALFGSGSDAVQNASGIIAPSMNMFGSNSGSGTSPSTNLFASRTGTGTSGSVTPAGLSGFGQPNAFSFKSPAATAGPLVSPDSQPSSGKDSGASSLDPERPQKRSMSSFQPDLSKRQQPVVTMSTHAFTAFGTSVGTSAAVPVIPVTFAAAGSSSMTSHDLFSAPFGQASSSGPQTSSVIPSAGLIPFTFGTPGSTAGIASTLSGLSPSFPSFPSPVYGTAASGSTFGVTPAAPLAFGSTTTTTPAFGSASTDSTFGSFVLEALSQSPATPAFGSGFTSPSLSPSPGFPFGPASPAFAFSGAPPSSSGAGYTFGSSGAFPFTANKSVPASPQPSIFGLSSSVPAFGSTTNGTMASDVVVSDHSNMDDNSMAEEPSQMGGTVLPQPSIFSAQSSVGTGSFVFGGQGVTPGAIGPTTFGVFQPPTNPPGFAAAAANPFAVPQPGGSLDFDPPAGGAFSLGSGGDRMTTRKFIKAKRTGAKRGK